MMWVLVEEGRDEQRRRMASREHKKRELWLVLYFSELYLLAYIGLMQNSLPSYKAASPVTDLPGIHSSLVLPPSP